MAIIHHGTAAQPRPHADARISARTPAGEGRIRELEAEVERLTEALRLAATPWRLRTVQGDFFPRAR